MDIRFSRKLFRLSVTLILAAVVGFGPAQESQAKGEMASTLQGPLSPSTGEANGPQSAPWFVHQVDGPDAGAFPAVAFDPKDGSIWVSYYDVGNGNLKLAHHLKSSTGNCGPGLTWDCQTIDSSSNDHGQATSLDIYYNASTGLWKLGVTYYNATYRVLNMIERFQDANSSGTNYYNIDFSYNANDGMGKRSSLKFDHDGVAHVAYTTELGSLGKYGIKYAHYVGLGNGNCQDNSWQCDFIKYGPAGATSYTPSLDIDYSNGPRIAFYDAFNQNLDYAIPVTSGGDCGPGNLWVCWTIDSGGDVGKFPSLHASHNKYQDRTQIAYYDATNGQLKYARPASSGNCGPSSAWLCAAFDAKIGQVADPIPLGIALGVDSSYQPIIAYMTNGGSGTNPINLNIAYPQADGNCSVTPDFAKWNCEPLDRGGQYAEEAHYVSLAVNPGGMIAVAYSELNTYDVPNTNRLKVVFQEARVYLPLTVR